MFSFRLKRYIKTVFGPIFKHIVARRIFNYLHDVWRCGQRRSQQFDISDNKTFVTDRAAKFLLKREYDIQAFDHLYWMRKGHKVKHTFITMI